MPTTDNGWEASPSLDVEPFVVEGVSFPAGIVDNEDVKTVMRYVITQYHERVERLVPGWCWGYYYKANVNSPNELSRHAGGIAFDVNAPRHPNGVPTARTFSSAQIAECQQILAECRGVVRWGGNYNGTPDAMHWEIDGNHAEVASLAAILRDKQQEDDMADAATQRLLETILAEVKGAHSGVDALREAEQRRNVAAIERNKRVLEFLETLVDNDDRQARQKTVKAVKELLEEHVIQDSDTTPEGT